MRRYLLALPLLLAAFTPAAWGYSNSVCPTDDLNLRVAGNGAPVAADFDGDGHVEFGVYAGGRWSIDLNHNGVLTSPPESGDTEYVFGTGGYPVYGDFDGNGTLDLGFFSGGQWVIDLNNNLQKDPGDRIVKFGSASDLPVFGDFDGDGTWQIGVFRGGTFILDMNQDWVLTPGVDPAFPFGQSGDLPVFGIWTGSGLSFIGVYRQGEWMLDRNGNFRWDGERTDIQYAAYGRSGLPVIGDWNGDGVGEIGLLEGSTGLLDTTADGRLTIGTCDPSLLDPTGNYDPNDLPTPPDGSGVCSEDSNANGVIEPEELDNCANGICPLGMQKCANGGGGDPICPPGGVLNGDRDMCQSSPEISCPQGYAYSSELDRCLAPVQCAEPGAAYNPATGRCEVLVQTECPPTFTLDQAAQKCVKAIDCGSLGSYNESMDRCETPPDWECPQGYVLSPTGASLCVAQPVCQEGLVYTPGTDRCEKPAVNTCASGYSFDAALGECTQAAQCTSPGVFNTQTDLCEAAPAYSCPTAGYTYVAASGRCEKAPSCSAGTYSPTFNKCLEVSSPGCQPGYTYVASRSRCEMTPACISGSYNPATDQCVSTSSSSYAATPTYSQCSFLGVINQTFTAPPGKTTNFWTDTHPNVIYYYYVTFASNCEMLNWQYYYTILSVNYTTPMTIYSGYILPGTSGQLHYNGIPSTYSQTFNNLSAPSYTCPSGGTLSGTTCTISTTTNAPPSCPSGTLDYVLDVCQSPSTPQCSGDAVYDSAAGACTSNAVCTAGVLDGALDVCYQAPAGECPAGYALSGGVCEQSPSCGAPGAYSGAVDLCVAEVSTGCDAELNLDAGSSTCWAPAVCTGGSLNDQSDQCETPAQVNCGDLVWDPTLQVCASPQVCAPAPYNPAAGRCEASITYSCQGAMDYDAPSGKCVATPICPTDASFPGEKQFKFTRLLDTCVNPALVNCSPGFAYTGTPVRMCEAVIQCPSGSLYDVPTDTCSGVGSGTVCPAGDYPCAPTAASVPVIKGCPNGGLLDSSKKLCVRDGIGVAAEVDLPDYYFLYADPVIPNRLATDMLLGGPALGDESFLEFTIAGGRVNVSGRMWQDGFWSAEGQGERIVWSDAQGLVVGAITLTHTSAAVTATGLPVVIPGVLDLRVVEGQMVFYNPGGGEVGRVVLSPRVIEEKPLTEYETFCSPNPCTNDPSVDEEPALEDFQNDGAIDPATGECLGLVKIFNGRGKYCLKAGVKTSFFNCCNPDPSSFLFIEKTCPKMSTEVAVAQGKQRAHYIGDFCVKKWPLIGCVQEAKVFCVFESKLARIVHEQGRQQLKSFQPAGNWGTPDKPNCEGFSPLEFSAIDFGRLDLSEAFPDLMPNVNDAKIQQEGADAIQRFFTR